MSKNRDNIVARARRRPRQAFRAFFLTIGMTVASCQIDSGHEAIASDGAAFGAIIEPIALPDNPGCQELRDLGLIGPNYYELKIDPPTPGTYLYGDFSDDTFSFVSDDGVYFNWSSTLGVDAVISKGGSGGNAYLYDPEATEGFGLASSVNSSGHPAAMSHITVCIDFEVDVSKTAETSYQQSFDWTIDKSAAVSELLLNQGQHYSIDYTISLHPSSSLSDFKVFGTITVSNKTPFEAEIQSVEDWMDGAQIPTDCPSSILLAPGESFNCRYETMVADNNPGINEVEVIAAKDSMVGGNSAKAPFSFGEPSRVVDECVLLEDSLVNDLGEICVGDSMTIAYQYDVIGTECGSRFMIKNTVSATAGDTGTLFEDSALVNVTVAECGVGCTLTQGYWKTHSEHGPAPYDATWADLPNGADTVFLTTGPSYYEILWTAPQGGNSYFILAHQYIAAYLNTLADGSVPQEVTEAMAQAEQLLADFADDVSLGGLKGKEASHVRALFLHLAGLLAQYNEGALGPGHCDESRAI